MSSEVWKVFVLPSSHNDIGWAGTPSEIAEHRSVNIMDKVIDIMQRNASYCFAMESSLYMEEYVGRNPHRLKDIQLLMEKGQLEWGGTYIQPYESLLSGESLLRQVAYGKGMLEKEWGLHTRGVWNVDVAARAIQIPQILQSSGIDYLVLSRNKPGLYWWEAPNGSRILVLSFLEGHYGTSKVFNTDLLHFSPLEENSKSEIAEADEASLDNTAQAIRNLIGKWEKFYADHALPPYIMVCCTADYTVPEEGIIRFIERWNGKSAEWAEKYGLHARMELSNVDAYLKLMASEADFTQLPVMKGELPNPWIYIHGPCHEKTISTMRTAAAELIVAEQLSSIYTTGQKGISYPAKELDEAWKAHLYPDHGYGGLHGIGTDEIFRMKQDVSLMKTRQIAHDALEQISRDVSLGSNEIIVYNPLSWTRTDWLECEVDWPLDSGCDEFELVDGAGQPVAIQLMRKQRLDHGAVRIKFGFTAAQVPSLGIAVYRMIPYQGGMNRMADKEHLNGDFLWENDFLRVRVTNGGIAELFDKKSDCRVVDSAHYLAGEIVEMGSPGTDVGEGDDANSFEWHKVRPYQPVRDRLERTRERGQPVRVTERNELKLRVETTSIFANCEINQSFILYRDHPYIDVEIDVRGWKGTHSRELRVMFPVFDRSAQVFYEVPYHHIAVGQDEVEFFHDLRPREVQNWMQAAGDRVTLTISGSTVAYDWLDPLGMSDKFVLQSILLATKRSCHSKGNWYSQEGDHRCSFRITGAAVDSVARTRFGWSRSLPLRAMQGRADKQSQRSQHSQLSPITRQSFCSVDQDHVMVTAWRKAEANDAYMIRLWEFSGKETIVKLNLAWPALKAERCTSLEQPLEELACEGGCLTVKVEGHSITTVKVYLQEEKQ